MERLMRGPAWVSITFDDGSVMTLRTSLNRSYLKSFGIHQKDGYLYDLDKLRYVKFRDDAIRVDIFDEKPEYESEVLKFASRFI